MQCSLRSCPCNLVSSVSLGITSHVSVKHNAQAVPAPRRGRGNQQAHACWRSAPAFCWTANRFEAAALPNAMNPTSTPRCHDKLRALRRHWTGRSDSMMNEAARRTKPPDRAAQMGMNLKTAILLSESTKRWCDRHDAEWMPPCWRRDAAAELANRDSVLSSF